MYSAGGSVPRNEFKLISAGLNSPKLESLHLMNQSYAATYTVRYKQFDMDSSNIKGSNHFSFFFKFNTYLRKRPSFFRLRHKYTVENRSGISILLELVAFGNILN